MDSATYCCLYKCSRRQDNDQQKKAIMLSKLNNKDIGILPQPPIDGLYKTILKFIFAIEKK